MTIENLREMARYSIKRASAAPRGPGGTMPAAGAPSVSFPCRSIPAYGPASPPRRRTVHFTVRTDRRDRTTLRDSSAVTPPSHRSVSRYVPFSPWYSAFHYNLITNNSLTLPSSARSLSNHIAVTVDIYNSALHNCARTDGPAIGEIPGTYSHTSIPFPTISPDVCTCRSMSHTYSWKGAVP